MQERVGKTGWEKGDWQCRGRSNHEPSVHNKVEVERRVRVARVLLQARPFALALSGPPPWRADSQRLRPQLETDVLDQTDKSEK